jgi:nicotinamide riboside kinase
VAKIVFCGTHSTGKTVLAQLVSEALGIPYIPGPTRRIPKEKRGTEEGQREILATYIEEFCHAPASYICDRSLYDVIAYSIAHRVWPKDVCEGVARLYAQLSFYPDIFIYLPIEFDVVMDVDRPAGDELRKEVDRCVCELLEVYAPRFYPVRGTPEQRASEVVSIYHRLLPDLSSASSSSPWLVAEPGSTQEALTPSEFQTHKVEIPG